MRFGCKMCFSLFRKCRTYALALMELRSSECSDADYGKESSGSNPLSCEFYHATQLLAY